VDFPQTYSLKFQSNDEGKPRNPREEILDKFMEKLNASRVKAGFRPMTHARLAKIFEGVPTEDLWPAFKTCENARSFGSMFWHLTDPKTKKA
jgi:hypothetical protein